MTTNPFEKMREDNIRSGNCLPLTITEYPAGAKIVRDYHGIDSGRLGEPIWTWKFDGSPEQITRFTAAWRSVVEPFRSWEADPILRVTRAIWDVAGDEHIRRHVITNGKLVGVKTREMSEGLFPECDPARRLELTDAVDFSAEHFDGIVAQLSDDEPRGDNESPKPATANDADDWIPRDEIERHPGTFTYKGRTPSKSTVSTWITNFAAKSGESRERLIKGPPGKMMIRRDVVESCYKAFKESVDINPQDIPAPRI